MKEGEGGRQKWERGRWETKGKEGGREGRNKEQSDRKEGGEVLYI